MEQIKKEFQLVDDCVLYYMYDTKDKYQIQRENFVFECNLIN